MAAVCERLFHVSTIRFEKIFFLYYAYASQALFLNHLFRCYYCLSGKGKNRERRYHNDHKYCYRPYISPAFSFVELGCQGVIPAVYFIVVISMKYLRCSFHENFEKIQELLYFSW